MESHFLHLQTFSFSAPLTSAKRPPYSSGNCFLIFQKDSAGLYQVWKESFLLDAKEKRHQGRPTDRARILLLTGLFFALLIFQWDLPTAVRFVPTFKSIFWFFQRHIPTKRTWSEGNSENSQNLTLAFRNEKYIEKLLGRGPQIVSSFFNIWRLLVLVCMGQIARCLDFST